MIEKEEQKVLHKFHLHTSPGNYISQFTLFLIALALILLTSLDRSKLSRPLTERLDRSLFQKSCNVNTFAKCLFQVPKNKTIHYKVKTQVTNK